MKRNYWKRGRWLWEIDLKLTNITDFNLMIHEFKIKKIILIFDLIIYMTHYISQI